MKRDIIAWLLFIIFVIALSYYACESAVIPQDKPRMRVKQLQNAYQLTSELKRNSNRGAYEGRHDVHVRTFQKAAKGVYGGGDMLRPRTKSKSGAYSLLLKPSSLLPLTLKAAVGLLVCIVLF